MMVKHHPEDDLLLAYSAGALGESWSLAVATHMALCPACRRAADLAEHLGGAMLDDVAPQAMTGDALERVLKRLDESGGGAPSSATAATSAPVPSTGLPSTGVPEPLRHYIGPDLERVPWRKVGGGGFQHVIETKDPGQARLLRFRAGKPVPEHGHRGRELTLVMAGSFSDHIGEFHRGDLEDADERLVHQPVAGSDQDCVCLAVTDHRLRFTGLIPRLAQPFIGV